MINRNYYIIMGSKSYFKEELEKININLMRPKGKSFKDAVKDRDAIRIEGSQTEKKKLDTLVISNQEYFGLTDGANNRLVNMIEEMTTEDAKIYIHNPSKKTMLDIKNSNDSKYIDIKEENYIDKVNTNKIRKKIEEVEKKIKGQSDAINEISKSIFYLAKSKVRKNPYVIMLYGNSGIGKTEVVRAIGNTFYQGKYFEKHLSMFQNNEYLNYFFGNKPGERSMGFDLLEQESNLIFLDEMDKCPKNFYSAFYTLFDNKVYEDATYSVNIAGTLIILTSNYLTEDQMQKDMGDPIFYRIDKFIKFKDFSEDTIYEITKKEILNRKEEYEDICNSNDIYSQASQIINLKNENARTIKNKVQEVIEDVLYKHHKLKNKSQ